MRQWEFAQARSDNLDVRGNRNSHMRGVTTCTCEEWGVAKSLVALWVLYNLP